MINMMDLCALEKVKSRYLKRVLGVGKQIKNTYVHKLTDENLFVSDLKEQYNFPETENLKKIMCEYTTVHASRFNDEFLRTPAMQNDVWKQPFCLRRTDMYLLDLRSNLRPNFCKLYQCFEASNKCLSNMCGELCTHIIWPSAKSVCNHSMRLHPIQVKINT
jgi:hypothetical protein